MIIAYELGMKSPTVTGGSFGCWRSSCANTLGRGGSVQLEEKLRKAATGSRVFFLMFNGL